jgi:hypothetical protein
VSAARSSSASRLDPADVRRPRHRGGDLASTSVTGRTRRTCGTIDRLLRWMGSALGGGRRGGGARARAFTASAWSRGRQDPHRCSACRCRDPSLDALAFGVRHTNRLARGDDARRGGSSTPSAARCGGRQEAGTRSRRHLASERRRAVGCCFGNGAILYRRELEGPAARSVHSAVSAHPGRIARRLAIRMPQEFDRLFGVVPLYLRSGCGIAWDNPSRRLGEVTDATPPPARHHGLDARSTASVEPDLFLSEMTKLRRATWLRGWTARSSGTEG